MVDQLSRRRVLTLTPVAMGVFSGCVPESGRQATLRIDSLNVSKSDGSYAIEVIPEVGVGGDWEPFRNVDVVVQNEAGSPVCRHQLGELGTVGEYDPVQFSCHEFPYTISYEFDRGPCADQTSVLKRVYVPEQDWWSEELVTCDR